MLRPKPHLVPAMMLRALPFLLITLSLSACNASWKVQDQDDDGYTPLDGDCWDSPQGPGVSGLSGADIHPAAEEIFYDGFDQNCAGDDDYDQDGDGWVPDAYQGLATSNVEGSGQLPAGDCWDEPLVIPSEQRVVSSSFTDAQGTSLSWEQPAAADIHPEASELWYDGADSDCNGGSDFDQDGDGYATEAYPDRAGVFGDDCIDGSDIDPDDPAGLGAAQVNPDAGETFYDGTDQDCDANDCDADGDGYDADPNGAGFCENDDCDDEDAERFPDPSIPEVWYDGIDQNCDNNDGDFDGDDYWAIDYVEQVEASGGVPMDIPVGFEGDCDDIDYTSYPGAADTWYDGVDSDCAGDDDYDQDLDGYQHDGYGGTDCDDTSADVNPAAMETWYDGVDQDCDGLSDYDQDLDGHDSDAYTGADCDDTDVAINPDATETWYDGVDQDCDGLSDYDQDADGYDSDAHSGTDCDDTVASVNPGATDTWYDGVDTDCDGASDYDQDADGYDSDAYSGDDCDDTDVAINPGASETWYDGVDADCDGASDYDQDADGYDSDAYAGDDCDDSDAAVNPGVAETWYDGIDGNCDGLSDYDQDKDGYEADAYGGDDCADLNAAVNPAATEVWYDGTDSDCDGASDYDQDGDGYDSDAYSGDDCDDADVAISPAATEVWYDGTDQDCDGASDYDQDADGYDSDDYAGDDCDDAIAGVNPGMGTDDATTYNMVDDDCDGWLDENDVTAGSLIISEVNRMSTAGSASSYTINRYAAWFEVYNTQSFDIAMDDMSFRACFMYGTGYGGGFTDYEPSWYECHSTAWFAVSPDAGIVIPAGGYAVLCADDTVFDDPTDCDYMWADTTTWTGSNPGGRDYSVDDYLFLDQNGIIGMYYAGSSQDDLGWSYTDTGTDWPYLLRYSTTLSLSYLNSTDNDDAGNWCDGSATEIFATSPISNFGTPGYADSGCP
jgi:large repetitive protein